jgi:hypothetical protein
VESLPSKKNDPRKKREQGLKSKRGHMKRSMLPKKEDEIYKMLGEILSKERQKGYHIFL